MDENDWVVRLDLSNRAGIEFREIYGYAGLALNSAQILEHVLKQFIILGAAILRQSLPPATAEELAYFKANLEKFEQERW